MLLFGDNQIGPIYLGDSEITSIYQGDELIYTASVPITNYATFTAQQANSTIGLQQLSSNQKLWYSTDGEQWEKMTTSTTITLTNSSDSCYIAGVLNGDNTSSNYTQFKMTGEIASSGNCNYLWNYENPDAPLKEYCGYNMFYNCTSLTTAPELPATTLADYCYTSMFWGCSSLTTAPELPATIAVYECYHSMFAGCTSLTTAPELPATKLGGYCYLNMFRGCTSLTKAPELPATDLNSQCYADMFYGCTSLEKAPELPATTLTPYCYNYMFYHCSNLNYIKCLATNISAIYSINWVDGVAGTGTFVKNPNATSWTTSVSGIPSNWTVEDTQ